jgi:hypothetical protein
MKLNLFVNYYKCGDPIRQKELDFCFNHNRKSGLFNEIINFEGRMTYNDFFKQTHNYPDDVNILSNLDIYFNESILLASDIDAGDAYALTRWEIKNGAVVSFETKHNGGAKAMHSQDVWIIKGAAKPVNGNFNMGVAGCDNRIAYELAQYYKVTNPSDEIKCVHKHKNESRNYTIPGRVPPPFMWVPIGSEAIAPSQAKFRRRNI